MSRSIMINGACDNITGERRTTEKRHDLLGPEPTTEPVTSCLGVPVPSKQKLKIKGPTTRAKSRLAATIFLDCFRTPTATLPLAIANGSRLARRSRSAETDQLGFLPGKRTVLASRPRSCATATPAKPAVPGMTPAVSRPTRPSGGVFAIATNILDLSIQRLRAHSGRPAAHPTATGWDEELLDRAAGVRLPGRGAPSHRLGQTHQYVLSCFATGTDRDQSDWRT